LYAKIANLFTGVNSDSVRKYATIAYELAKPNSQIKGDALIQFGNSYHMENKIDSALKYYNKAFIFFQKTNNEKGIGKVYQSYALVKRSKGDYEGSIIDSEKALKAFVKINWTIGRVNVLNNISNAYVSLKKYKQSIEYSRQSLSLSKELNDSLKYYFTMAEYGGKLLYINSIDSAIYYINQATPYLEKNNQYNTLLVANSNLGETYFKIFKSPELSLPFFYKCINYSKLSNATDNLGIIYRNITSCYISLKNQIVPIVTLKKHYY
jgi:tetratricopeptide (TPR) repeat protein